MSKPSQICIFTEAKKVFYVVSVSPSQWLAFVGQAKVDINVETKNVDSKWFCVRKSKIKK